MTHPNNPALPPTPFEEAFQDQMQWANKSIIEDARILALWAYHFGKKEAFREAAEVAEKIECESLDICQHESIADRLKAMEGEVR